MPAVSVIMPAFNVESYIGEAIESVLAQTYTDWELVLVDDGSKDGTRAVAERYRAANPDRIIVVSHENRGLAAARNSALRVARGSVFALLDSDDIWEPGFLAAQMRLLDEHPDVAIVTGNATTLGGALDGQPARPTDDRRPPLDLAEILRDETSVFIMSIFRREVVHRIGGFDERFRTNEDYDFWVRAASAGFRFIRNPKPLAFYRRHGNNLSASDVRMLAGILRVFNKAREAHEPGTEAHRLIEQQIDRFETELLAAEAREALGRGDVAGACTNLDALRRRRGGLKIEIAARAFRLAPRAALWVYRTYRDTKFVPRFFAVRSDCTTAT
ncbi:MAG TPA: glycosyltransferase [Vicinamibacterales bacterium]